MTLDTPLSKVHQLRKPQREALERLELRKVRDALLFTPIRYDMFDQMTPVNKLRVGQMQAFRVRITSIANKRTRKRGLSLTEAIAEDKTGPLRVIWFNQPYLPDMLKIGTEVILHGKVKYQRSGPQLSSPKFEKADEASSDPKGHIVPVYSASAGISTRTIMTIIRKCLPLVSAIEETLPPDVSKRQKLVPLAKALAEVHQPSSRDVLEKARERLAFEELYDLQLEALQKRKTWKTGNASKIVIKKKDEKKFLDSLPFSLTGAQDRAWKEIRQDISMAAPMYRLLQGDVGSGKTLVAVLASLSAAQNGSQTVFMAPTDLLAKQHYETLLKLLKPFSDISVGLYTRTSKRISCGSQQALLSDSHRSSSEISKTDMLSALSDGSVHIVVGTHALIQSDVVCKSLSLVIIDEQHRFGVEQREVLRQAGGKKRPHFLSMTATPIPRTLALAVYADLDVSVIDEMPPGRKPILTRIVPPRGQAVAEKFMRQEVEKGRQVFAVCPLIEESDVLEVTSAEQEFTRLSSGPFSGLRVALLHGRLPQEEKDATMQSFVNGDVDVLVSTSVIEVGVDIPNAVVMAIYGAERFGLAQLHQFRGRVGRGEHESFCFAVVSEIGPGFRRLKAFSKTQDGFELAQNDLEQRGPGELAGIAQSGLPDLRMASLMDTELLSRAQKEAQRVVTKPVS